MPQKRKKIICKFNPLPKKNNRRQSWHLLLHDCTTGGENHGKAKRIGFDILIMYNRRESAGRRSRKVSTLQAIKTEKRKKAPIGIDYFLSVCYSTGGKPHSFKFYFIFRRLAVLFTSFSETGLSIGFHISCPCILTFDESSYWCTMTFIFDWFFPQWYLFRNCLVKKINCW